jgi:hypothetical protein
MERTGAKDRSKVGSVGADWVVATGSAAAKGLPVMVFEGHFEMLVGFFQLFSWVEDLS